MSENPGTTGSEINRRTALKGIGIGAAGFSPLTKTINNNRDTTEITIVENSDGPLITKTVDREWYQHEQHVEGVAHDAKQELLATPGIKSVGIGAGKTQIGGRAGGHLRIYTEEDAGSIDIPTTYQQIPVERIERGESYNFSCTCNNTEYNAIPGGVKIATNYGTGSAGCMVELNDEYYMLTAAHLFPCNPSTDPIVGQGPNNNYFGYVDIDTQNPPHFDAGEDWALITLDEGGSADGYEKDIEDYTGDLSGHVTKDGLTDFMCSADNPETVYKQGYTTCKDQGCILDRNKTDGSTSCSGTTDGFIEANIHIEKGDSGGILFQQFTYNSCYYTAPIGIVSNGPDNAANNCTADDKPATNNIDCISAYKLNNEYGINFDPRFSLGC